MKDGRQLPLVGLPQKPRPPHISRLTVVLMDHALIARALRQGDGPTNRPRNVTAHTPGPRGQLYWKRD